jgi:hypothetical protein
MHQRSEEILARRVKVLEHALLEERRGRSGAPAPARPSSAILGAPTAPLGDRGTWLTQDDSSLRPSQRVVREFLRQLGLPEDITGARQATDPFHKSPRAPVLVDGGAARPVSWP